MYTNTRRMCLVPILFLGILLRVDAGISATAERIVNMKKDILTNYEGLTGPRRDLASRLPVNLGISIKQLELNDELQIMIIYCNLVLSWSDDYLSWNRSAYRNLDSLSFDTNDIWTPNIALYNGVHKATVRPSNDWPVWVTKDGQASWSPDFTAKVPCKMDLYYWPSDTQKCVFRFASWADNGEKLDITLNNNRAVVDINLTLENFQPNRQWRLVRYATKKEQMKNNAKYIIWDGIVTVKRNGVARMKFITHSTIAVLIVVLLAYVVPISFHLSRILMHLFALGALTICDIVIFLSLPNSGGQVPLIVNYYSGTIVLTTISLVIHCVMISLFFNSKSQKILRKQISLIWPFSKYRTAVSEEVGYIHLSEEVADTVHQTGGIDIENEDVHVSQPSGTAHIIEPQVSPEKLVKRAAKLTLLRTINATLFVIFAIAFTIDYAAMISMIASA